MTLEWVRFVLKVVVLRPTFVYLPAIANAYTALEAGATHIDTCKSTLVSSPLNCIVDTFFCLSSRARNR